MRDQIYGYLVAWERHHFEPEWAWLAVSTNLHGAILIAQDWERYEHDPECPACVQESSAHVFSTVDGEERFEHKGGI